MESPSPTPIVTSSRRDEPAARRASSGSVLRSTFGAARPGPADAPTAPTRTQSVRPVELPPERRLSAATLAGLAAAAGIAAIVLGGWAFVSGVGSDQRRSDTRHVSHRAGSTKRLTLLAKPNAERLPLQGSVGRIILVVQPSNDAALVLNGLGEADSEWAYQVWVTPPDSITPRSAGLFSGREIVVPLTSPVPPGAVVAVTLEPATGSFAPTRRPKLVVERPV